MCASTCELPVGLEALCIGGGPGSRETPVATFLGFGGGVAVVNLGEWSAENSSTATWWRWSVQKNGKESEREPANRFFGGIEAYLNVANPAENAPATKWRSSKKLSRRESRDGVTTRKGSP